MVTAPAPRGREALSPGMPVDLRDDPSGPGGWANPSQLWLTFPVTISHLNPASPSPTVATDEESAVSHEWGQAVAAGRGPAHLGRESEKAPSGGNTMCIDHMGRRLTRPKAQTPDASPGGRRASRERRQPLAPVPAENPCCSTHLTVLPERGAPIAWAGTPAEGEGNEKRQRKDRHSMPMMPAQTRE